jgi:hypothetical protein
MGQNPSPSFSNGRPESPLEASFVQIPLYSRLSGLAKGTASARFFSPTPRNGQESRPAFSTPLRLGRNFGSVDG